MIMAVLPKKQMLLFVLGNHRNDRGKKLLVAGTHRRPHGHQHVACVRPADMVLSSHSSDRRRTGERDVQLIRRFEIRFGLAIGFAPSGLRTEPLDMMPPAVAIHCATETYAWQVYLELGKTKTEKRYMRYCLERCGQPPLSVHFAESSCCSFLRFLWYSFRMFMYATIRSCSSWDRFNGPQESCKMARPSGTGLFRLLARSATRTEEGIAIAGIATTASTS